MSESLREKLLDGGLLLHRVVFAAMMIAGHGWDKLTHFSEKVESGFPDPIGVGTTTSLALAVFAEFFCSVLLALGLGTRVAAFFLMFTMGVAAFVVHAGDPFRRREMALLYLVAFLALLLTGGGRWALDRKLPERVRSLIA